VLAADIAPADMLQPKPITLEGAHVRLLPLSLDHLDDLCAVGLDEELWKWVPSRVLERQQMLEYVQLALDEQRRGLSVPFVTTLKDTGQIVGSTRYANISVKDGRLEIGWTWIGKPWQRSAVNTEAKYLMHASCLRGAGLHPRRAQDRRPQREITQRHTAHRRKAGRHTAQAHHDLYGPHSRHRLLQHPGR